MEEIAQIQLPPFTTKLIISHSGLLNTSVPSDDVELNKSTYILVCPNCAQTNSLISQLHADVVELPGNRRYFVFDTLTFCLVIWNDFMEVEHLDDEYLFEFRRFCTKTKFINNLWFYLPKKIASEQQQQYAQIFNQFKAMFKKDIVCFFVFSHPLRVTCTGIDIDQTYLLKSGCMHQYMRRNVGIALLHDDINISSTFYDACIIS